ncbi:MAG: hypothetical protein N2490_08510 [Ignavibacteria bacterium]|nr:hypothetical protein [Ignavibacteria bacterium]
MKKYITIVILITCFTQILKSQINDQNAFGIKFTGFVKYDMFYDSRVTQSIREGHFLVFPEREVLNSENKDINAKPSFNFLSLQTRVTGKITGPEFFDAKTSGLIEGEFFGTSETDLNGFRLRHAFVKIDWESFSILAGQFWHPMFVTDCSPATISFNTGAPFQPFTRNPQIRFTIKANKINIIAAAMSQRDFQSNGPNGFSSIYLRNSLIPDLHLQFQYKESNYLFGFGGGFKSLVPRTVTTKNLTTDSRINSLSAIAYAKFNFENITFKLEGVWGQNLADMTMIGGYAIKSVDTTTGKEEYTNMNTISSWIEVSYSKNIEIALFAGYTKNLGADENTTGVYYTRGGNIDYQFRLSPRFAVISGNTKIATEIEITSANIGVNDNNDKGKVINGKEVTNIRGLISFIYNF